MIASFNLRVDMVGALKIVLLYHSGMCFFTKHVLRTYLRGA